MAGAQRVQAHPAGQLSSVEGLAILGLTAGEPVRWQNASGSKWLTGRAARREKDGSVGIIDSKGASRSLPVERLQVRRQGSRGGQSWEPLVERAGRSEQLRLL